MDFRCVRLEKTHGKSNVLYLSGRIDTAASPFLHQKLKDIEAGTEPLILDFSDVHYISSSGLRELLIAVKKFGKEGLLLDNVVPEVEEILKTTGFSELLNYTSAGAKNDILDMSFRDLLHNKLLNSKDKPVVKSYGVTYTWADIDRGASVIASELYALGVGKGTHVAICGANSVNWILTFWAIQKLGAIAVLVNPQMTADEIIKLSHIGDITHFCYGKMPAVSDEFLAEINSERSRIRKVFDIRDSVNFLDREAKDFPSTNAGQIMADDVCVMIFTSGSTGTPKGALHSAYSLLRIASICARDFYMTEDDNMCVILPLFHIFGLILSFIAGAVANSLLILPDSLKPEKLLRVIHDEKCTILHSVPTVLLILVNAPEFSSEFVSTITRSGLGGAPISEAQLRLLMKKFPNNNFMPGYGLSEITPVSFNAYNDSIEHITQTIGKPLEGIDVKIQDTETHKDCPVGVMGEILVQGHNLMCSYYKFPVEDQPFDDEGFLHTGDLGFLDEDGYIHFSGRAKELIIRGGENIIPNEVASAISEHENISDVKVLGVPDEVYGESVAAAVIVRDKAAFDANEMREFLHKRLAKYKIPSYFFVYEKFPVLSNGKIDVLSLKREIMAKVREIE